MRGRLGLGCDGPQEIKILNRIVSVDESGLRYEADPRHTDLLMASLNLSEANAAVTPGVKPSDRDEFAVKADEDLSLLSPDAAIAAIVRGDPLPGKVTAEPEATALESKRPRRGKGMQGDDSATHDSTTCDTSGGEISGGTTETGSNAHNARAHESSPRASDQPTQQFRKANPLSQGKQSHDKWVSGKGTRMIRHGKSRNELYVPSHDHFPENLDSISSLRLTIGVREDQSKFAHVDSWRSRQNDFLHGGKWWGTTILFSHDCHDMDGIIARLSQDVVMKRAGERSVRFSPHVEAHDIVPYAEQYELHPHHLLATASGWKRAPARSDPFTGKSSLVMRARRKAVKKSLCSSRARKFRQQILAAANSSLADTNEIYGKYRDKCKPEHMETDMTATQPTGEINVDFMDISVMKNTEFTEPYPEAPRSLFATRTKPLNQNKYQKRMGAKKAKRLELDKNSEFTLSPADATTYRALAARCNYLSQDRPDISFASKELCRELSIPNLSSFKKLKRLVRYLSGLPRLVYHFPFQEAPTCADVYTDTDFAGCASTRRSTSGGCIMVGSCTTKHWSKTQSTISLSSGEAELHGIAMGCSQGLGIQSLMKDLGWTLKLRVLSDATAAIGIARRKGLGKLRHLDCTDLWIQDTIRSGRISLEKVLGTSNPADILTKYVEKKALDMALAKMNLLPTAGRPVSAPAAMGT